MCPQPADALTNDETVPGVAALTVPETELLASWEPEPVDWIWFPYVPKGMLTVLSGIAGAGKTYIALDIAAAVTAGRTPVRGEPCPAASVLYLACGDNIGNTIRPRFDAAGGDAQRLRLQRDPARIRTAEELAAAIAHAGAALVIIDPVQSYFTTGRAMLEQLSRVAEDRRCAILLVHALVPLTPRFGHAPQFRPVRSELLAGAAPDDSGERALVHVRSNCCATGPTLGYAIEAGGAFRWKAGSGLTAWAILSPEPSPQERTEIDRAMEFLRRALSAGPRRIKDLNEEAIEENFCLRTLRRAKVILGITKRKYDPWNYWVLPGTGQGNAKTDAAE